MVAHPTHKMLGFKAFADDVVEDEQDIARVTVEDMVDDLEIIVVVQHIQVVDHVFVGDVFARETDHLVEDGERITQGTIGLLRNDIQGLRLGSHTFVLGNKGQMFGDVIHRNTLEVKDLATRKDGGNDFVLLRRG